MRFKQFINEDSSFDESKFEKDCKYYLDMMGGTDQFMYHGTKSPIISGNLVEFRPRSGPTDSPIMLHNAVNEFFEQKFKIPFRNGLFVTGQKFIAVNFASSGSNVAIVVPKGHFQWLSSPDISDLTGTFQKHVGVGPYEIQQKREGTSKTIIDVENAKWYHNEHLLKCLSTISEVMLWCPNGFYTFTPDTLPRSML